jgi:probable addiction module antidote protein
MINPVKPVTLPRQGSYGKVTKRSEEMTKKKKRKIRAVSIEATVLESLIDPEIAAAYIRDCLKERGRARSRLLLRALMNVAQTQGISSLAKGSESRRRLIYKVLSDNGNPRITTVESILNAMGLAIDVRPLKKTG